MACTSPAHTCSYLQFLTEDLSLARSVCLCSEDKGCSPTIGAELMRVLAMIRFRTVAMLVFLAMACAAAIDFKDLFIGSDMWVVQQISDNGQIQLVFEHRSQLMWGTVNPTSKFSAKDLPYIEVCTKTSGGLTLREKLRAFMPAVLIAPPSTDVSD